MTDDNDIIKNSIDAIEPDAAAKVRMRANISAKAEKSRAAKRAAVKKLCVRILPVAACIALFIAVFNLSPDDVALPLSGGGELRTAAEDVNTVYVDSVAELEERLDIKLPLPDACDSPVCAVMDGDIAVVSFNWHGRQYELRSAKDGDLGSLDGEVIASAKVGSAVLDTVENGGGNYLVLTWDEGGAKHCLVSADCSPDDIRALYYSLP